MLVLGGVVMHDRQDADAQEFKVLGGGFEEDFENYWPLTYAPSGSWFADSPISDANSRRVGHSAVLNGSGSVYGGPFEPGLYPGNEGFFFWPDQSFEVSAWLYTDSTEVGLQLQFMSAYYACQAETVSLKYDGGRQAYYLDSTAETSYQLVDVMLTDVAGTTHAPVYQWVKFTVGVDGNGLTIELEDDDGFRFVSDAYQFGDPEWLCPLEYVNLGGAFDPWGGWYSYMDDFAMDGIYFGSPNHLNARHGPLVGDPVNLADGNSAYTAPGITTQTKGTALSMPYTYNNMDDCFLYGILGCDWFTPFDQRIFGHWNDNTSSWDGNIWLKGSGEWEFFAWDSGESRLVATRGGHAEMAYIDNLNEFHITDTAGVVTEFDGDSGDLLRVRDRFGEGFEVGYYTGGALDGLIHAATSTAGPRFEFNWGQNGMASFRPDNNFLLSVGSSEPSKSMVFGYLDDPSDGGKLKAVTLPGGQTWTYGYSPRGHLASVTDPGGIVVFTQEYSGSRKVSGNADGKDNSSEYRYDGHRGTYVDPMGARTTASWDERAFRTAITDAVGAPTQFGYSSEGDLAQVTDSTGAAWITLHDSRGNPTAVTDPLGNTSTSSYRPDHQPEWTEDPTGVRTTFEYDDSSGALESVQSPGGGTTMLVNNTDGTVSATISPDGLISRTEYDNFGRPVRQIDAANRSVFTRYNPDGTVSETIGPDGATSTTSYDSALRPVTIVDPLGHTTSLGYDASGSQNSVTDPRGQTTNFGYDAAYNLYETSTTIEGGQVVDARFSYDAANRLDSVTAPGSSGTSSYTYTPTGRIRTISDADGATTSYEYSRRGEVTETRAPDGSSNRYYYDAAGRVVSMVNSDQVETTYGYDAAGRPLTVANSAGSSQIYQYDSAGRMSAGADTTNVVFLDGEARVFGLTQTLSPGGRRTTHAQGRFAYEAGALIPRDTSEVAYYYRDDGSLDRTEAPALIGQGSISNSYDPTTGRLIQQSRPGQVATYQYGLSGQIEEMTTTTGPGEAFGSQTRYDPAGNVIEMGASYYTYDALGRLLTAHDAELGDDYEYQYDLASNRTEVRKNGEVVQNLSFATADVIDTQAHPEYAYDAAGRLISDTTAAGEKRSYRWDGYGRLSSVDIYSPTTGHSDNLQMSYDSAGRLSEKRHYIDLTWPVERLFYHYDGDRLISEEDMTGTVREYLYAGGEAPTAMRSRNSDGSFSNFFFITNTHGDVVALTDKDGNVVNRYAYGPWGEATRVSEQVHQPFRYAGYRYEDGFDLYYLRARWMDPNTGRFLSRDPVRGSPTDVRSLNRYAYGKCIPPTATDPSGLSPTCRQGIYRLAEFVDEAYRQFVQGRPNSASNVGQMMDYLYGVLGGPGNDFSLFDIQANGEPLYSMPGNTGWKSEYVDEPDPTHHFISFLYYGWLDFASLIGTQLAYQHEAEPYFLPPFSASGAGGTQEDYRLSKAAVRLGYEVRLGADWKVRTVSFSGGGIKASELSGEILRRFSTGTCKPSAVWATPFF